MKKTSAFLFFMLISVFYSFGQCPVNQSELTITIVPDNYPAESTWKVFVNNIQIANGTTNNASLCVDSSACIRFEMYDSYGDGICCGYGNGSFNVQLDGLTVASGGQFSTISSHTFNCPQGSACNNPIPINFGSFTAPYPNTFYSFTPSLSGMYSISTCDLNTCNTKLWVYESCNSYVYNVDNTGTLFYNDNNTVCGNLADINAILIAGTTYIIKVGINEATTCSTPIGFSIIYDGPIVGCMDPQACNYNPNATVSDSSCVYYPSPDCMGPDLTILQDVILSSLELREEQATNCQVVEGCMTGYGQRTVLAFTTWIKNIGDIDYYVGNPTANPTQFTFGNCHGHAHYEGYADYILYRNDGQNIPIGHKNGFCVMDLECNDGGTGQYGCSNMGISKQCGDIYSSGLDCQWIDITDVDTAEYILAIKVNWDQSPDALGHYETNYANNWAQVCLRITMNSAGEKGYEILPNCQPYVDCAGTAYGNAMIDCQGNCNGTALRGDLNNNSILETNDVVSYLEHSVNLDLNAQSCNDLSADNIINVWDAGLLSNCISNGATNNSECSFPNTVQNPSQVATFSNEGVYTQFANPSVGYMDISILNPNTKVTGYQFAINGATISGVSSLINPLTYPVHVEYSSINSQIAGLSLIDSMIPKHTTLTPFIRVFLENITSDSLICLSLNAAALNNVYEPVTVNVLNPCSGSLGVLENLNPSDFMIYPNPSNQALNISYIGQNEKIDLRIFDALGNEIYKDKLNFNSQIHTINTETLSNGVYYMQLSNKFGDLRKSFTIVH